MLFVKQEPLNIISSKKDPKPTVFSEGASFGYSARGKWLYFGLPISKYNIALRRSQKWLRKLEIASGLFFGLAFLGLFLIQILATNSFDLLLTNNFWTEADLSINSAPMLFWLATISFLFSFYRFLAKSTHIHKVEQRQFGKDISPTSVETPMVATWEEVKKISRKNKINVAKTFTNEAIEVLENSYKLADKYQNGIVTPIHVLHALLECKKIYAVFLRLGIPVKNIKSQIISALKNNKGESIPSLTAPVKQIIFHAYELAYEKRQEQVYVTEILVTTIRESKAIQDLLYDLKVDGQKLTNVVEWVRIRENLRLQRKAFSKAASKVSKHGIDKAMTAVATPFLNSFSKDITLAAKFGYLAPCVARDREIEEIFRVIEGGRQSIVLVGEHGVGKQSIIEGIVQKMIVGDVPKRLYDKRMVQLSTSSLLAGTTVSGAQERLIKMMNEIRKAGNIILFVNNIHDLVSINEAGGGEGLDVSESLAEFLGGNVLLFATTTTDGYNRNLANSQLGSKLSKVDVREMNENQAIQVIESKIGGVEYKHNVFFSYDAIAQSVTLASRFLHDQTLPESALEIVSEAASFAKNQKGANSMVTSEEVAAVVSDKTGVPTTSISEDESSKLLRLEDEMHKRVIGQNEAVELVSNALRRARAEIRSTKRPIANFLFLGPTGVGKTELAKTIASVYFGGENRMIRIDMSEFQDKSGIYRLIGQPGQKGSGLLTEAVRQEPFSLILLDEMEKADPDILNLFLQVFDDGRLTDSVGRVIDFTNTIIISTSNAGTSYVQQQITSGVELETIRQSLIRGELKNYYRPEFLNRFDGIVLFRSLQREEIKQIAGLMLKRVETDLEKRGVGLRVEDEALEALAEVGFDPEFGARPMRRAIQDKVENKLAELILAGNLKRRDTVVLGAGAEILVERA